jgi:uncharacterized protein (DUF1697 family)
MMASHAAFLKGMNLGRRRITNAELAEAFAAIGFPGARTFRASGNVSFDAGRMDAGALAERIEAGLAEELGYPVATFVRSARELGEISALQPFASLDAGAEHGKLQVALLAAAPAAAARRKALALADERDRLELHGSELYWLPSGGVSDSVLDLRALERLLGAMTLRTKGTIEQLTARHFAG